MKLTLNELKKVIGGAFETPTFPGLGGDGRAWGAYERLIHQPVEEPVP